MLNTDLQELCEGESSLRSEKLPSKSQNPLPFYTTQRQYNQQPTPGFGTDSDESTPHPVV